MKHVCGLQGCDACRAKARENRLIAENNRLRIKCGRDEMLEGDYATLIQMEQEIERSQDKIKALRKYIEACKTVAKSWAPGGGGLHNVIMRMGGEIERLQAFVDKCPITADKVPVVPGQTIYNKDGIPLSMPQYASDGIGNRHVAYPDVCYSTPEAAEKARTR